MNQEIDAFDEAPNMVPGEVEDSEQFDPASGPVQPNGAKAKLSFVLAGLLFAGGWVYANKEDFKDALGIRPAANLSASTCEGTEEMMMHGCCPEMMAAMASEQTACPTCPTGGSCPLSAEGSSVAAKGTCCEDGRKKAMVAALLEGTQDRTDEAAKAAASPNEQKNGASQSDDTAKADGTTDQQENVSTEAKKESEKESSADASKQSQDVEADTKP